MLYIIIGYILGMFVTAFLWGKMWKSNSWFDLTNLGFEGSDDSLLAVVLLWPMLWLQIVGYIGIMVSMKIITIVVNLGKQ